MVIAVPCYNEAARLRPDALLELVRHDPATTLLLIDDGSTDDTLDCLQALRARAPERIVVLSLAHNAGKAEAVRQGMLAGLALGAPIVGYSDADLATPVDELRRLVARIRRSPEVTALLAARVALAGRDIERRLSRHYLGRVFSTCASLTLQARIYDTQCGAKFFRSGPLLAASLAEPFRSRWTFDVELIGRLLIGTDEVPGLDEGALVEEPLERWVDIAGSKLRRRDMVRAALDLALIAADLHARRQRAATRVPEVRSERQSLTPEITVC